jgi:hypothetical protein
VNPPNVLFKIPRIEDDDEKRSVQQVPQSLGSALHKLRNSLEQPTGGSNKFGVGDPSLKEIASA